MGLSIAINADQPTSQLVFEQLYVRIDHQFDEARKGHRWLPPQHPLSFGGIPAKMVNLRRPVIAWIDLDIGVPIERNSLECQVKKLAYGV